MARNLRRCAYPMCNQTSLDRFCEKHAGHEDKKRRYCAAPNCNALVVMSERYCAEHINYRKEVYDANRQNSHQRGYDGKWKKTRASYVALHPLCEECLRRGKTTATRVVHHITPIKDGGSMHGEENLEALCYSCHSSKPHHGRR